MPSKNIRLMSFLLVRLEEAGLNCLQAISDTISVWINLLPARRIAHPVIYKWDPGVVLAVLECPPSFSNQPELTDLFQANAWLKDQGR